VGNDIENLWLRTSSARALLASRSRLQADCRPESPLDLGMEKLECGGGKGLRDGGLRLFPAELLDIGPVRSTALFELFFLVWDLQGNDDGCEMALNTIHAKITLLW